jgi:hypothetical protein
MDEVQKPINSENQVSLPLTVQAATLLADKRIRKQDSAAEG